MKSFLHFCSHHYRNHTHIPSYLPTYLPTYLGTQLTFLRGSSIFSIHIFQEKKSKFLKEEQKKVKEFSASSAKQVFF